MHGTHLHCTRGPYCGEAIELVIDAGAGEDYVEDCSVCCRPMRVTVRLSAGAVVVTARREDDA